jgi:predicted MPP superfamily phosphohydrolase
MKKIIVIILSVVLLAVIYLFLWNYYPKNIRMFPLLIVLIGLDIYLYWVYRKNIWNKSKIRGYALTFLFWIPFLMILSIIASSVFYHYDYWPKPLKIYFGGFIFVSYVSKLIPVLLILISDLVKISRRIFRVSQPKYKEGIKGMTRSEFIKKTGLVMGGIFFGTLTLGMFKWIYDFKVRKNVVNIPLLPQQFMGFRIVQISDLHLGSWVSKNELKEAVSIINDLNADVVFFTGDLVNYSTDEAYPFEHILKNIQSKHGVYAILGNHDYGDYKRWSSKEAKARNMEDIYDFYKRLGWKLLLNENQTVKIGEQEIAIIGVENWGSMGRFQKYGDLDKAIAGVEDKPVKLLLSHDPSHWELIVSKFKTTIDVTFAGHTHGAQFGIEIPRMRWSPAQYIYNYWAGLYSLLNPSTNDKQYLYVNRGIGAIGYPGRVGILPEITVVELQT